jgi:DNA-binding transcriptional MerR regulator
MTPRKLYKIGEVMKYTGLSRQTIHNYTMMGLIHEAEPQGLRLR